MGLVTCPHCYKAFDADKATYKEPAVPKQCKMCDSDKVTEYGYEMKEGGKVTMSYYCHNCGHQWIENVN